MSLMQSDPKTLEKGSPAPEFSLENTDGKTVPLSDFKGKPVVIIFMCNHCPYVKPKMDEIAAIQNDYDDKAAVICINPNDPDYDPDDSPEQMKKIAAKYGYRYYLFDETQETARSYGATCTPDPFVFDKDHKLVFHGRINDAMNPDDKPTKAVIREVLDKTLKGEDIEEWFQPSMGCSIKWK
ncbi:thioredoxin family protein [Candidatus Woesearchaeota archaeon]|nr:thioredoxin family protein [Candidatus Woesearchaeota archaeon]